MGPLADWDNRLDILSELASHGMLHLLELVFHNLTSADLRAVRLVNSVWFGLVQQLIHHGELSYLSNRWKQGEPKVDKLQCKRERSVCTVTSLAVDDRSIAAGLGSSGKIEVWDRRKMTREVEMAGHKEGIYTLQLGRFVLISGGEDGKVRVWSRKTGEELAVLDHHTYIVWSVKLHENLLVTASYDCTVCYLRIQESEIAFESSLEEKIQGPWEWADALYLGDQGGIIVVHDEETFQLQVWSVKQREIITKLVGHTDEVHAVEVKGSALVSGSSDRRILLWNWRTGRCLAAFEGHEGKIWSLGLHRTRIASGGRFGEVRVWEYPQLEQLVQKNDQQVPENSSSVPGNSALVPENSSTVPENSAQAFKNSSIVPENSSTVPENSAQAHENSAQVHENTSKVPVIIKESRPLLFHPKSTSVSVLHIDSFCLVTGDGLASLIQWDFWYPQTSLSPCNKYCTPVPDPLLSNQI